MEFKLQSPSGKLELEIFKEKEDGYYDYKITDHGGNLTCFIYGQTLKNVFEMMGKIDSLNLAQWIKSKPIKDNEKGIKRNNANNIRLSKKDTENIIQSYMDGTSPLKIAEKYGTSPTTIRSCLNNDDRTKDLRLDLSITKKQEVEIFELNSLGFKKEEIAKEVGCGVIDVLYHLKNPRYLAEEDVINFRKGSKNE